MDKGKPKWDRHSILAEFRRKGVSLRAFAMANGRHPSTFGKIWTSYNRINEQLIAEFLGEPVEVVFPDRYPVTRNRLFHSAAVPVVASRKSAETHDRSAA